MSASSILDLIKNTGDDAAFKAGYYQAQVTAVDSVTGQVYLQQVDDEDSLPDEAPYTALRGFLPEIGDWVWVARWGRTSVVIGALNREDDTPPGFFRLPGGNVLAWGTGDPNGDANFALPVGSIYMRTAGILSRSNAFFYVKTTADGLAYGWLSPNNAPRTRSIRQLITYLGGSTSGSFARLGFPDDPTVTQSSASNADASTGAFLQHNTSTVANNVAKVVGGSNSGTELQWNPRTTFQIRSGTLITLVRYWYGLFSGTPEASADPAVSGCGFRFDTSAGDTNLMLWCNDGSGGGTIVDSGFSFAASSAYELTMDVQDDYVDFYISGGWVGRITSNLPAASTAITYGLYCTTLGANQRNLRWGRITIESEP